MSENLRIRVCLGCRKYIIINEKYEEKKKLYKFEGIHFKHTLVTSSYNEKDYFASDHPLYPNIDNRKAIVYEMV